MRATRYTETTRIWRRRRSRRGRQSLPPRRRSSARPRSGRCAANPQLVALLAEMIPLAAHRGGGLTWEYYFKFDGGLPPWTSAMSQGTGLEALTRGYLATHNSSYLQIAEQALPIFSARPTIG